VYNSVLIKSIINCWNIHDGSWKSLRIYCAAYWCRVNKV